MARSDESRDLRLRFPKTASVGTDSSQLPINVALYRRRVFRKKVRAGTMFGRNGPVTGAEEFRSFCWLNSSVNRQFHSISSASFSGKLTNAA